MNELSWNREIKGCPILPGVCWLQLFSDRSWVDQVVMFSEDMGMVMLGSKIFLSLYELFLIQPEQMCGVYAPRANVSPSLNAVEV